MSRAGCSTLPKAESHGRRAAVLRFVAVSRQLAAALVCAALLQGCGGAPWEEARQETEDTARTLEALKPALPGPRFSAIRVIERRPWLGLVRREGEPPAALGV